MIVLDASAAVEWLLGRPGSARAAERLADPELVVHAPSTLPVERASAFRGLAAGGHLGSARVIAALQDLADADVCLHNPSPLLLAAWRLRENLTIYDALYVVLARVLDAEVLTADARMARAASGLARIELLAG